MAVSATIIGQSSGSPLAGSPIIYKVEAGEYTHPVFHRVKLQVVARLTWGGDYEDYKEIAMSSPAEEGEEIFFNVSSALCAVADKYERSYNRPQYEPYIEYYLVAWDEYMINGTGMESAKSYFPNNYQQTKLRALIGAYSDVERRLSPENRETGRFTRKPNTVPEIVRVNDTYIRPVDMQVNSLNISHGQECSEYRITQPGLQTVGGVEIYAIPANTKDCYPVRFYNGLGCMESLTISSFRETNVNFTTEVHTRVIQETFNKMSRGIASKQNDYETWRMSSGPVDETWMSWYIHEFLMAKWMWINIGESDLPLWVACHVIPDETVVGPNNAKKNKMEVVFSLQFDITGSLMRTLAV